MLSQSTRSVDLDFCEEDLKTAMECLSFLTARFFTFDVKCISPGGSCSRISDTIVFLKRNFEREEKMMDIVGYPEARRHKSEHENLLRKLAQLKVSLVCSGYDNALLFDLITGWQKLHIPQFDEPLGKYLHKFENENGRLVKKW